MICEIIERRTHMNLNQIACLWNMPGRHYHDIGHAFKLIHKIEDAKTVRSSMLEDLILAILFHDIIYVPGARNNELMSAQLYAGVYKGEIERNSKIVEAIGLTDYSLYPEQDISKLNNNWIAAYLRIFDLDDAFNGEDLVIQHNFQEVYEEYSHIVPDIAEFRKHNHAFMKPIFDGFGISPIAFERYVNLTNKL